MTWPACTASTRHGKCRQPARWTVTLPHGSEVHYCENHGRALAAAALNSDDPLTITDLSTVTKGTPRA